MIFQATRTPFPLGGRVEVLLRGTRGMDAERGAKGQGRPFVTAPRAAPERGKSGRRPDPDVGVAFSLVTFSWPDKSNEAKRSNSHRLARRASVASQVTRPGGNQKGSAHLVIAYTLSQLTAPPNLASPVPSPR